MPMFGGQHRLRLGYWFDAEEILEGRLLNASCCDCGDRLTHCKSCEHKMTLIKKRHKQ